MKTDEPVAVSQEDVSAAESIAVRALNDYRRRDGLTCYVHDDNRRRDEAYIKETFREIVAPAFALRRVHRRLAERERQIAADRAEELALRRRYAEERNMLVPRFETLRALMMKESGR